MIALCYENTFYDSTVHTFHESSSVIDQSVYNCFPILQFYAMRLDFNKNFFKVKPVQISIYQWEVIAFTLSYSYIASQALLVKFSR